MALVARRFPDPEGEARFRPRRFGFHRDNVVLDVTAEQADFRPHTAPLSLKAVFAGEEVYAFGGAEFPVAPGRFLLLDGDCEYASRIDCGPVRSFCVFFADAHAASAADAMRRSEERRLDAPAAAAAASLRSRVLSDAGAVGRSVAALRSVAAGPAPDAMRVDELCIALLRHLLAADCRAALRAEHIGCVRRSVREEILRRLERAASFARCHLDAELTIDLLAGIACMAPCHFLRRFTEAYGVTPHRFVTGLRMEEAARRLRAGADPVGAIARDVGYADASAFARAFRARTGVSPSAFRRTAAIVQTAEKP